MRAFKTIICLFIPFFLIVSVLYVIVPADELPDAGTVAAEEAPVAEEPAADYGFPDVSDSSAPYYKPVYWAMERDYVRGYQDGSFGPIDSCSRQQFVIMLWRLAGRPSADTDEVEVSFSDITPATPGYGAILWAVSRGIIRGYDDGTFHPEDKILRSHVAIMLWRFQGKPGADMEQTASFSDVGQETAGADAIYWGAWGGVIRGFADGTFRPDEDCTRAQIVIMFYRFVRDVRFGNVRSSKDPEAVVSYPDEPVVSSLATSQVFTDHCDSRDGNAVRFIIVHHMAGRMSGEQCAAFFRYTEREVSANYCIGYDGDISCSVPEQYRSYSASNREADKRAISIEVSDISNEDWVISEASQEALAELIADIISRYHEFGGIAVFDPLDENVSRECAAMVASGMSGSADWDAIRGNIITHSWVSTTGTGCPGEYTTGRLPYIASRANELLH